MHRPLGEAFAKAEDQSLSDRQGYFASLSEVGKKRTFTLVEYDYVHLITLP